MEGRFLVDIHEVDAQHQTLAGCIVLIETAVTTQQRWSTVHSALRHLAGCARIHFAVEEGVRTGALANRGKIVWARRFYPKPITCAA